MPGTLLVLIAAAIALCCAGSCAEKKKTESELLDEALLTLAGSDFKEQYDRALSIVDRVVEDTRDKELAYRGILYRAKAHLDLLVIALMTGDEALGEKAKSVLNWRLEGAFTDARNFQLLAQDIMEEFRVVEREADSYPGLKKRAAALAKFCNGLQGVLFRSKQAYFDGRDAVKEFPEFRYLDDQMAMRDLIHEVLKRTDGPAQNWQNIVLSVCGRVCLLTSARFIDAACMPESPESAEEYCNTDYSKLSPSMKKRATAVMAECRPGREEEREEPAGLDAIKSYYDAAYGRLVADREKFSPTFRKLLDTMDEDKEAAYEALKIFFGYINSPPNSR